MERIALNGLANEALPLEILAFAGAQSSSEKPIHLRKANH
jgi:hypothetical protein